MNHAVSLQRAVSSRSADLRPFRLISRSLCRPQQAQPGGISSPGQFRRVTFFPSVALTTNYLSLLVDAPGRPSSEKIKSHRWFSGVLWGRLDTRTHSSDATANLLLSPSVLCSIASLPTGSVRISTQRWHFRPELGSRSSPERFAQLQLRVRFLLFSCSVRPAPQSSEYRAGSNRGDRVLDSRSRWRLRRTRGDGSDVHATGRRAQSRRRLARAFKKTTAEHHRETGLRDTSSPFVSRRYKYAGRRRAD